MSRLRYRFKLLACFLLILSLVGCDAFVRKFTRKSKKDDTRVEMVLAPQEYKPSMSKQEEYRQYFMFWKAWHDELINALLMDKSQKKKLDCIDEAIKSLVNMRPILNEDKQRKLDMYIGLMQDLRQEINRDTYGNNDDWNRNRAEQLKRNIQKEFAYDKVKNYFI